ncbi:MAG: NAD(P)/FAD-dependent oxidoreductase [Ktedonobacterales bacterium]
MHVQTTAKTGVPDASRPGTIPIPHAPWSQEVSEDVKARLVLDDIHDIAMQTVDVVVIGAGIAGLSAASTLGAEGLHTMVLDAASEIGCGATGRNAGILSAGINMGLADLPAGSPEREMWPATTRVLLSLVEEGSAPGALLMASHTGALSLAETRSAARHLAREARARNALGLRAEEWDASQVAEVTGGRLNTSSLVAALWLPDEGRVQPLTLLAHYAEKARRVGATLAGNAHVLSCEAQGGGSKRSWRVLVDGGIVVVTRGLIVATGPTREPTARIFALAFDAHLPASFPLFWDAAPYTYCDYRPGDGYLVTSGGRYGRAGGSPRDGVYHKRLAEAARYWLPELGHAVPTHAWAVDLAVSADMVPHIRALGELAPGFAVEGLGALGVLPGIVLGEQAAERVIRALG